MTPGLMLVSNRHKALMHIDVTDIGTQVSSPFKGLEDLKETEEGLT